MQTAHSIIQRIAAIIAIFNNCLLIILIKFKSHRKVGKYKFLMIYISIFEILYAVVDTFAAPTIFTKDSMFVVVVYADQELVPFYFMETSVHLFCVFYGISMAIFAIHFIYRFLVVSENNIVKKHNGKLIFGMLLFPILFGIFWFWVVNFFVAPFDKADDYLSENRLENMGLNISDVAYAGAYFWPIGADGHHHPHWKTFIGVFIMIVAIVVSFGLICFFGYKCYRQTKQMIQIASTQSASFNKLQTQLFYALVYQTVIPVFLMHVPASIGFSASFFNCSMEIFGEVSSVTIKKQYAVSFVEVGIVKIFFFEEGFQLFKRKVLQCKGSKVGVETAAASELASNGITSPPSVAPQN
ncbi:CRE-STR-252 protein [Caenorhabditis remanei]|uniref:CRE-STR-252 protein n=1 Tax=Caenorhabditis remanei TaxID=31234 RepID=E3M0I9_CAERE|nr:CRE-STR-252 protein [Caenorhabditis remanei]